MDKAFKIVNFTATYLLMPFIAILVTTISISFSSIVSQDFSSKFKLFKPVIEELLKKGADTNFVLSIITNRKTEFNEKFVKLNVTGFLHKPDFSFNYDRNSINLSRKFINNNYQSLEKCEDYYGVPKEIITAILWVETKHGNYLGTQNLPSVFLSTSLASQPKYISLNLKAAHENFNGDSASWALLDKKIMDRAQMKSKWAINELMALDTMKNLRHINPSDLYGSGAGAFGLPQFLPSSYLRWAVDGDSDGVVDLFNINDAIFSVANYLKCHGWNDTIQNCRDAVFSYNNSSDYVDAVFTLANKLAPGIYASNFH